MLKETLRELPRLIGKFIKPYGLEADVLKVPKTLNKLGTKVGTISMTSALISLVFAYMLKLTNIAIEAKFILLGIIIFMVYRSQNVIKDSLHIFESNEDRKFETLFDNEILLNGSQIITMVSDKVLKLDPETNAYKIMSNEVVMNSVRNYLSNLWKLKIRKKFQIVEITSAIVMLVFSILTNTAISQKVFVPLILIFAILSFVSSAYISTSRDAYYQKHRKYGNEQYVITNDLLRVPAIVKQDLIMRIGRLKASIESSSSNLMRFHGKVNRSHLVMSIIETLSSYGVIILYLVAIEWNSIDLGTITEITANLVVVETALGYIRRVARMLEGNAERVGVIEREEENIKLILDVYNKQCGFVAEEKYIDEVVIPPFAIKYVEESENDKPFMLKSEQSIILSKGDVAILYGVSGSGKSTFMKMLTERIKIEKTTELPSTSRYLYYDERMRLGSLSIYDEIFCLEEKPNHSKMEAILTNLHLWQELACNCVNVWRFLKEKKYEALSNGQKQRLVIAKMLYWLDERIDVVVFDECTSGLDDKSDVVECADAQRILEYIVRYCNEDKQRIVILSTHQAIEEFKAKIQQSFNIHNLYFSKQGDCNYVHT